MFLGEKHADQRVPALVKVNIVHVSVVTWVKLTQFVSKIMHFCSSGVAVYKLRQFFGGVHWISSSSECSDALSLPLSVGNDWSDSEPSRIGSGFGGIVTGTAGAAGATGGARFCAGTMRRRVLARIAGAAGTT